MKSIRKVCISTICSALLSTSASAVIYEVRVDDSLNVRSEPSTSGRWVGSLSNRTRVDVTEVRGKWGRISNGWICLDYAVPISHSIQPRQYRVNVNDSLLFRSGPGQNNNVIGSFGNGTVLTINEICNNWGKTVSSGKTGWICLDYATPVQSQTFPPKQYVVSVNDCLRFRSGPNTNSSIIEELRNGTVLTIGEISNGWGKATHNNHSGWVCMEYMKEYHAPAPAPVPAPVQSSTQRPTVLPVANGSSIITQDYQKGQHDGIDIGSYGGRKIDIYAVQEGTVREVVNNNQYNGGLGNYVIIDHPNGYSTTYMHLDSTCINRGQKVSAGNKIGNMGTTGKSSGVHLHFRVQHNGSCIDPNSFVNLNVFRA